VPTIFRKTGKKAKDLQKKVSTGPSADYTRYSDKIKKQGRIPMSFSNWIKSHG